MGIRFRPSAEFLLAWLLCTIGWVIVWLVKGFLASTENATELGWLAAAAGLLFVFVRVWRESADARRMAAVFCGIWFVGVTILYGLDDPSSKLLYAVVVIAISVGLWRARRWARWFAAAASVLACIRSALTLVHAYIDSRNPPPIVATEIAPVVFLAILWAAIAAYLVLPSTGARFAEIRAARGSAR